jgi:predicted AAA+ superfamily ATPase
VPLIGRALEDEVRDIVATNKAAVLLGPRQSGKSTLAKMLRDSGLFASMVTLDDRQVLIAARDDPDGFLASLTRPAVIDEIQRVPELMLAIKAVVDRSDDRGQFLLTGSANLLTRRGIADALPGRVEYTRLWPFSQSELEGTPTTLIDQLFSGSPPKLSEQPVGIADYAERIVRGGFPDAYHRSDRRRFGYFQTYVDTLIARDLDDTLAPQADAATALRLLRVLATRSGEFSNLEALARDMQVSRTTVSRYLDALEQLFLAHPLPPWSRNLGHRQVKRPKLYVTDSGLLCALSSATAETLVANPGERGRAVETFAVQELLRQSGWARTMLNGLYTYRDQNQREVDVVIEAADGRIVAVEVKSAASTARSDTTGLRFLRDQLGDQFVAGVVLHTGSTTVPIGERLWAVPLSALWLPRS